MISLLIEREGEGQKRELCAQTRLKRSFRPTNNSGSAKSWARRGTEDQGEKKF